MDSDQGRGGDDGRRKARTKCRRTAGAACRSLAGKAHEMSGLRESRLFSLERLHATRPSQTGVTVPRRTRDWRGGGREREVGRREERDSI